jgi:hypothetical protein
MTLTPEQVELATEAHMIANAIIDTLNALNERRNGGIGKRAVLSALLQLIRAEVMTADEPHRALALVREGLTNLIESELGTERGERMQ